MTSGVKQALPQFLLTKTNARQAVFPDPRRRSRLRRRAGNRQGRKAERFRQACRRRRAALAAVRNETRRRNRQDVRPRLETVVESLGTGRPDESEASKEEDFANAEQKPAIAEDADAAIPLPLPGIHIPPVQARRMPDGEKNAPTNAPAGESDIAISVDGSTDERGAIPVGDEGKSRDRPGDNAGSSPVMSADARPAAVTPEQTPKPQFFGPTGEPALDGTQENAVVDPDRSHADPAKVAPRATVLSEQSIPAPMSSTTLVLVDSIASSGALIPVADRPAVDAIQTLIAPAPAQSLKIQLHPAELGMVTATLRFAGEQLSIELKVENKEAYQRLSVDSETIVKSLRGLGYDIDRVTVLQPSIAVELSRAPRRRRLRPGANRARRRTVRVRRDRWRQRRNGRPAIGRRRRKCAPGRSEKPCRQDGTRRWRRHLYLGIPLASPPQIPVPDTWSTAAARYHAGPDTTRLRSATLPGHRQHGGYRLWQVDAECPNVLQLRDAYSPTQAAC